MNGFTHLKLKDWPFLVVPNEESITLWAGREELKIDLYNGLRKASRSPASKLSLIWAWFGSGKSHTLRHLKWLCESHPEKYPLVGIYVVYPGQVRNMLDIYKAIISNIDFHTITNISTEYLNDIIEQFNVGSWGIFLKNGFEYMKKGSESVQASIFSWLRGDKVHLNILKSYGISKRIESTEDCVQILTILFKIILNITDKKSILLMIDEFQEIGKLPPSKLNDINAFLHKLFDSNPNQLNLYLSFTTGNKETVRHLIGDALQNRISSAIEIPEMSVEESVDFLSSLLKLYADEDNQTGVYPFTVEALVSIAQTIDNDPTRHLIPRELIKAADQILSEADIMIEDGELVVIDGDFVGHNLALV